MEFAFGFRDEAVLDFAGALQVAATLGLLEFGAEVVELLGDFLGFADFLFFFEPLGAERGGAFLGIGEFFFELLEAVAAGGVFFLFEGGAFHFELHDFALELVEFGGEGFEFDLQAGRGFVHEIDGFVGQEAVADIAIAEHGGGDERGVLDANAVVDFVAFLESAQDRDGILDAGLADHDGLEAALEGGVFFDVFAVFVEGRGADGVEFAAGELGFQEIRGVHRTLGGSSADDGVEFVDEEDDLALAGGDFFEEGFEAVFEFATEFRARDHRADIHRDEAFVFQGFGDIARDDAAGEAFDDGGFADAGFADEDGVVFGAAGEHLHGAADLVVTANDGVDFPSAGGGGEVAAVFFEGLVFALGILIGHALAATHGDERLHEAVAGHAALLEEFRGGALGGHQREEEMLHAGELILEHGHLALGGIEDFAEFLGNLRLGAAANFGEFGNGFAEASFKRGNRDAEFFEKRLGESVGLLDQREQEMLGSDFGVFVLGGRLESGVEGLTELDGEFFRSHGVVFVSRKQPNPKNPKMESPAMRESPLFLAETGFDQILNLGDGFFGVGPLGVDRELRALAGGEHHEAHDALAIHALAVFFHPDLGTVTAGDFDKHRRRAGVEAVAILDDHFTAEALNIVRAFFLREDSHLSIPAFADHMKESLIELLGAVFPHILELLVQRGYLHEPCNVPPGANGQSDMRDFDSKDFIGFAIKPNSIHIFDLVPILQCHDEVQFFLGNDRAGAKNRCDVDDADAANLHVVSGNAIGGSDEFGSLHRAEAGDVVTDQAVAALDQAEDALAFTDAAGSANEGSHPEDADHAAVFRRGGREVGLQKNRGGIDEFHRDHARPQHGNLELRGGFENRRGNGEVSSDHETGHLARKEGSGALLERRGSETLEITHLGGTENLDAFDGKIIEKAGQSEAGAVDGGLTDQAVETARTAFEAKPELFGMGCVKVADRDVGDLFRRFAH